MTLASSRLNYHQRYKSEKKNRAPVVGSSVYEVGFSTAIILIWRRCEKGVGRDIRSLSMRRRKR